jgi:hypothetical protein
MAMARMALRLMADIHVGDDVIYRGRVFRVCGISPMSASPRRFLLEDPETAESVEALQDDVELVGDGDSAA